MTGIPHPETKRFTENMIELPYLETNPELELDTDEKRLVRAQQLVNDVRRVYNELDRNNLDEEETRLRNIQTKLSEAGLLLTVAEYEDIDDISKAIRQIEKFFLKIEGGKDEENVYITGETAYMAISSATLTDPMREL